MSEAVNRRMDKYGEYSLFVCGVQLHPFSERPVCVSVEEKYARGYLSNLADSMMHYIDPQRTSQLHFYYCQK